MTVFDRLLLVFGFVLAGCVPELPQPPFVQQPPDAVAVLVAEPPPPARVDVVPDPPLTMSQPVWVDGQWLWRGSSWVWEDGAWVSGADKKPYAKSVIQRRPDGQLIWYQGKFVEPAEKPDTQPAK